MGFSTEYTKIIATFHTLDFRQFLLALLDKVSRAHGMGSLSVVRVAIISEPIVQIPFKFQLWLLLGNTPRHFLTKKCIFKFFRIFFVSVLTMLTWNPMRATTFKTLLLPQITFESFQTFSEFFQGSSQQYCFGVFKF